jgi:hypothetical protein
MDMLVNKTDQFILEALTDTYMVDEL